MYCDHGRLADSCEDCALTVALERGYRPTTLPASSAPVPDVVERDSFVDRGNGAFTFVRAGDQVPAALAGLPRLPAPARPLTNF